MFIGIGLALVWQASGAGGVVTAPALLMESTGYILLEDGSHILLN
ncbi:MAG: hypothetical protein JWR07_1910 [Nevskia sp.]|nr:hypothetical protein [Nevskia sp.]